MKRENRRRRSVPQRSRRIAIPWPAVVAAGRRTAPVVAASLAFALLLVVVVPRAALWVIDHSYFAVDGIEFATERPGSRARLELGLPRVSPEELEAWAGVAPGLSLFRIEPHLLERRLREHPWIRRARVTRDPPRRVVVDVREHKPLAIVQLDELYYVDRRGEVMARLGPSDSRDLPIITGLAGGHGRTAPEIALPRVAWLLRRGRAAGVLGPISEVHFDAEHGMTMFPVDLKISFDLGWRDWRIRLARAERVLASWRGREKRLESIDLTRGDSVIVRVREQTVPANGDGARRTRV